MEPGTVQQASPVGEGVEITPLVVQDLKDRSVAGEKRYGTPLRAGNGRDALVDAYQEALDLVVYLRQAIEDRGSVPVELAEHDWLPEKEGLVPHPNGTA